MFLRAALWACLKRNVDSKLKFNFIYDDKSILLSTYDILKDKSEVDDRFDCKVNLFKRL